MIECTSSDICAATGAALLAGSGSEVARGIAIDSRKVEAATLFVAFAGEKVDGNDYIAAALDAGAGVVACTREPSEAELACARQHHAALVRCEADDATEFMLRLAGWWRARHDWCVVGVTGSVGKTTTKDMLAASLGTTWRTHATAGNFNNLIGVPITLLTAPEDAQVLVVEMGMNHPHEIDRLAAAAGPCVAAITNVGTSHIGLLGSRENIARAKGEIVAPLAAAPASSVAPAPLVVMTAENDYTDFIAEQFAKPAGVPVMRAGAGAASALHAEGIVLDDAAHPSLDVVFDQAVGSVAAGTRIHVTLSLTGAQVVPDLLLALGLACSMGVELDKAIAALQKLAPTHMRQEVVRAACGCRVIDDSYNASPDSTAAALNALCSMQVAAGGRRIAILGEIGELGAEEERLHELVGAYAAAKPLDLLVIVGTERANHMESAARLMGFSEDKLVRVADVEELTHVMGPVLEKGDLVLVKASRAAYLDKFVKAVVC